MQKAVSNVMFAAALAACERQGQSISPAHGVTQGAPVETGRPNAKGQTPAVDGQTRAPGVRSDVAFTVETVATQLRGPWGMAFLPDGRLLVTEKVGAMRIVGADGVVSPPIAGLPAVDSRDQGGLLDVALDPAFAQNGLVYWTYAQPRGGGTNGTAAARGRLIDGAAPRIDEATVIYRQEPALASTKHYGSRLVFSPDGALFITQGERSDMAGRVQAQKPDSLLGKIVRIRPDGTIPDDNPFVGKPGWRPEIFSIGHRNVQAAALNPATGELWVVDHGPRGGDEINVVRKGRDYGWPTITYGIEYGGGAIGEGLTARDGMEQPIYYWDPVIAPSGMAFYNGALFPAWKDSLFIGALGGQHLVRLVLNGDKVVGEERLLVDLGERIRDVRQGPDGAIYVLTDGPRGKLLKLVPKA